MAQATAPVLDSTIAAQSQCGGMSQLAKADFASSSQHVRERLRMAALDAKVDALQRQAVALGAEPISCIEPQVLLGVKIGARRKRGWRSSRPATNCRRCTAIRRTSPTSVA
jgi:hypothetical protein